MDEEEQFNFMNYVDNSRRGTTDSLSLFEEDDYGDDDYDRY